MDNNIKLVEKAREEVANEHKKYYDINSKVFTPGITKDEIFENYSKWASNQSYDDDLGPERYLGPMIAAATVDEWVTDKSACILDVAAGTGLVAEQLKKRDFNNIDALEPSQEMLNLAKSKGLYNTYICDIISDKECSIPKDTYEVVVTCGAMGEGHIPCSGLKEMIRITKPEGIIIIVMREEYLYYVEEYKNRLIPFMETLEKNGYWDILLQKTVDGYAFDKSGLVFVFRVKAEGIKNGVENGTKH